MIIIQTALNNQNRKLDNFQVTFKKQLQAIYMSI